MPQVIEVTTAEEFALTAEVVPGGTVLSVKTDRPDLLQLTPPSDPGGPWVVAGSWPGTAVVTVTGTSDGKNELTAAVVVVVSPAPAVRVRVGEVRKKQW